MHHAIRWIVLLFCFALSLAVLSHVASAQTYTVLHNFTGGADGANPSAGPTMDAAGNLYGTASGGGISPSCNGCGTVFKLTHHNGAWTFSILYSFNGSDGALPRARVVFGPDGTLYGTTLQGGAGYGIVHKLQPRPNFCASISCKWIETVLHSFTTNEYYDGEYPSSGDIVFDRAGNLYGATHTGGNSGDICDMDTCGTVYELTPSSKPPGQRVNECYGD